MNSFEKIILLIPAYNPDGKLVELVEALGREFPRIVVVDDGSVEGRGVLESVRGRVAAMPAHARNRGKGAALRTGFSWVLEHAPDARGVVTVDADGQHRPEDVRRVAEETLRHAGALVLGVRDFSGPVPLRSRFGNAWARWSFFLLVHHKVRDTQTGLRGVPASLLPRMLAIPGDRYEYEMRMLADAKNYDEPPVQVPIETVYAQGNASSHFQPVRDAMRTQWALLHFCLSGVMAFLVDNAVYYGTLVALAPKGTARREDLFLALLAARLVSSNFNYLYNRFFVFHSAGRKRTSYARYWGLVLLVAAASYCLTEGAAAVFDAVRPGVITALKIAVETGLFLVTYEVQRKWIFRK